MWSVIQKRLSSTYKALRIKNILEQKPVGQELVVNGWVKAIRRMKTSIFLDVDDGSSASKLQVIVPEALPAGLCYHCGVSVSGQLRSSSHPKQEVELHAAQVTVVGSVYGEAAYPFIARRHHPPDYVRQFLHVRARTNSFASISRLRAQTRASICEHFRETGYVHVDAPILSSNECEGGGDTFSVVSEAERLKKEEKFFGTDVFLSVSGQLHLEAMANGLSHVFTFNPAFRADPSLGRRHLAEFWMVEAEEAFLSGEDGLQALLGRVQALVQHTLNDVVNRSKEDLQVLWDKDGKCERMVSEAARCPSFPQLRYSEAVQQLRDAGHEIEEGKDLSRENELLLAQMAGGPVFVTHWPHQLKPFYMARAPDHTALCFDLLLPDVGEVAGGSVREHDALELQSRAPHSQHLDWYAQLRQWGGVPTAGYGLGFERLLLFLTGVRNIKDVVAFPRYPQHCYH